MPGRMGTSEPQNYMFGNQEVQRLMYGETLVWERGGGGFGFEEALTDPYPIMFMGSSTTQGYLIERSEGYVHNFAGLLLSHAPKTGASMIATQNSGTLARPTAPGFHFLNAGLGGTTTENYYGANRQSLVSSYQPKLVMHMIGSNDYQQQMTLATYKSNLRSVINSINSIVGANNVKHCLIHSYPRLDVSNPSITWAQYGQALSEVADEYSNAAFADTTPMFAAIGWNASNLMGDLIHTNVAGYLTLARFVAQAMDMDLHDGELIWGFKASVSGSITGSPALALNPLPESMQQLSATQPEVARRPQVLSSGMGPHISFDGSDDHIDVIGGFNGAHGFPITIYVVVNAIAKGTGGTGNQPVYSRSVLNDDGWSWIWYESGTNTMRTALNSAFAAPLSMNRTPRDAPMVLGITLFPNSRARVFVNSEDPLDIEPQQVDHNMGPWMKSLRLGANAGLVAYSLMNLNEIRFEHGGWDAAPVRDRVVQLAAEYGVTFSRGASVTANFNSTAEMQGQFPIRGFDARTASNSPRVEGWCFNGMLVAGDNSAVTHWGTLTPHDFNDENMQWSIQAGDIMNTVARPTGLILSSGIDLTFQLILQIGSGNINLVSIANTTAVTTLRSLSRTVRAEDIITVTRNGLSYTVTHNGTTVYTYTGTTANAAAWFRTTGFGYTGINMYSASNLWSTRVRSFYAEGGIR